MVNKITVSIILLVALFTAGFFIFHKSDNEAVLDSIAPSTTSKSAVTIVAFGDSLTAGYGLPASESYPAQLEAALRAKGLSVTVVNAGVSGETTRGNLERANFIREQNPDIVLLGIGGNDALRALPLEDTKANMSKTIDILQSGDNPPVVLLLQMQAPLNAGLSYKKTFDAIYTDISKDKGLIVLPFITTEVFLRQEYKLSDGIHLNKAGYQKVIETYLIDEVAQVVEKVGG